MISIMKRFLSDVDYKTLFSYLGMLNAFKTETVHLQNL